jgi:hypothetical protein
MIWTTNNKMQTSRVEESIVPTDQQKQDQRSESLLKIKSLVKDKKMNLCFVVNSRLSKEHYLRCEFFNG